MLLHTPRRTSHALHDGSTTACQNTDVTTEGTHSNDMATSITPMPPDLMPIGFSSNNAQDQTAPSIKPHMQLQHLNSSPAYGLSTSAFAYEEALTNDVKQRRYSHIVPIINYAQPPLQNPQDNQNFESRPFLVFESGNDNDNDDDDDDDEDDYYDDEEEDDDLVKKDDGKMLDIPDKQPRRKSALLKISDAIGRRLSQTRLSFSSVGAFSQQQKDEESVQLTQRKNTQHDKKPRASLCFLPVARTSSDPSCGVLQVVVPPTSPLYLDPLFTPNISASSLGHHEHPAPVRKQSYDPHTLQHLQDALVNVPSVVVTGASENSLNEVAGRSSEKHSLEGATSTTSTTTTTTTSSVSNSILPTVTTTTSTTTTIATPVSSTSNSTPLSSFTAATSCDS